MSPPPLDLSVARGRIDWVDAGRGHEVERERAIGASFDFRREERRVGHAERSEDTRAKDVAETRALDDLDYPSEHVGRDAVLPGVAGLMHERSAAIAWTFSAVVLSRFRTSAALASFCTGELPANP